MLHTKHWHRSALAANQLIHGCGAEDAHSHTTDTSYDLINSILFCNAPFVLFVLFYYCLVLFYYCFFFWLFLFCLMKSSIIFDELRSSHLKFYHSFNSVRIFRFFVFFLFFFFVFFFCFVLFCLVLFCCFLLFFVVLLLFCFILVTCCFMLEKQFFDLFLFN